MSDMRIIYSTFKDVDEAKAISKVLLQEKLIACSNIFPKIISIYEWEGEIAEDFEACAFLKTKYDNFELIEARIKQLHSYDTPVIIEIEVSKVNNEYLSWLLSAMTL